jgi:hypothetical protein
MNFIWRGPFWEFRSCAQLPPYIMGISNLPNEEIWQLLFKDLKWGHKSPPLVRPFLMPILSLRNINFFGRVNPKGGHSPPQNHIFLGSPHCGNDPHPWAINIIKHKAKIIMNLDICRSRGLREETFLCLLLMHISRCEIPLTLKD